MFTDEQYAEFHSKFCSLDTEPPGRLLDIAPAYPSEQELPYIISIKKMLASGIELMVSAFNLYYDYSERDRQRIMGYYPAALRAAIILTRPEHVAQLRDLRRRDVYPTIWDVLLLETLRVLLTPIGWVIVRLVETYEELDELPDAAFKDRFVSEWGRAIRFRDSYHGFRVHPFFSVQHVSRYLQLPHGSSEVRRLASEYLLHLCQERPTLLEVLSPLFKERAFRDRVRAAYAPLIFE